MELCALRAGSFGLGQAILDRVRRRTCRDRGLGRFRGVKSAHGVLLGAVLRPGVRVKDTQLVGIFGEEGRQCRFVSKSCIGIAVDGVSHVFIQVAVIDGFFIFRDGVEGGYRPASGNFVAHLSELFP